MRLHFFISGEHKQGFHSDMVIVKRVLFYVYLPFLFEIIVSVNKIPWVPTMTLCFEIVVNMEDKHTLNLDKFRLYAKLLLSCP